ncbi:T9SS type A sorting domain-containing protein [Hymenobacter sp. HMF4947]|uniref:T9SS type A sorting domain-containing protein n=1 Tax=Hymenobacter ginkgonis TaxID=2682976 RepID=A0A7K1T9L2_9BACT|nr:T9SS type A sorting domain-containing protein [Hymenobacter ginkgonis]MVN74982.1 T9SS type A sorting domain-containing protein [Hymenobacter ginkgonis]
MKNTYLKTGVALGQCTSLLMLWLSLLLPAAVQAQTLMVEAAPGNTLPLQDFGKIPVNRASAQQSFRLSGADLIGNATVTAPDGFELRVGTNAFVAGSLVLTPTSGTLSATTIDVRFAPVPSSTYPAGTGDYASTIALSTPGQAGSTAVAVSGTAPAGPYVFVDPANLAFGQISGSGSGQVKTFVVGGNNLGTTALTLTAALTGTTTSGAIQVRNPAVVGSLFSPTLTLAPVNGQVPATTIEVRIVGPIAGQSNFTGSIMATSGSAVGAPTNVVSVTANNPFSGANTSSTFTVSTPSGNPLQPFSTVPEKASASQTVIVSGSFLVNGVVVRAPANFQVSLDATFSGQGSGTAGTVTANSLTITPAADGTINNQVVYIRYVPAVAGTESGTGVRFDSSPATPSASIVRANSIGTIESRTIYTPEGPLVIGTNVRTAPQLIRLHAELVRNPARISVSGESTGALGNPDGYAQFRISLDGVTYTDPTNSTTNYIQLTPDPTTNIIDQDIYVIYAPNRVGAAQAVLQYLTPDVTAAPANTLSPVVNTSSNPAANKLQGTAIDVEPTRDTPFSASRTVGAASAAIAFNPDPLLTGYGEFHIVLISTSPSLTIPDVLPKDGTDYNASNGAFQGAGQSTLQDSNGNTYYVVFSGGAPTATITGLNPNVTYYAYVFDYNSTNIGDGTFISNAENYKGPAQTTVFGAALPGNPLPVSLSLFTAQPEGPQAVRLNWHTASELNNAGFTVERSVAGQTFVAVGQVSGAGSSNTLHTYSFLDASLPAKATQLYYRLRQTDLNGATTYSPVRTVSLVNTVVAAQLLAYPNPARETVFVRLVGTADAAPLQVFDATGRMVHTQAIAPDGGETTLSLADLPLGFYLLRCGTLSQRLVVK